MKVSLIVVGCLAAAICCATEPYEYDICMEYLTRNLNATAPVDFALRAGDNGLEIVWNIETMPKPTFAQLDAVKAEALAWKSNQVAEAAANIEKMEVQLKCVIRALVKTVNERLPAGQKITEEELKAAIKAEALR